ncbi:MAG: hypothetical protein MUF34_27475 [Polyangiaceae bacterium]|jgi:hypothetical protein|nr:hypothetical protein [Polyangiaceae bacterium]
MESPRPPLPRALAFMAILSWMLLAPTSRQVFGLKNNFLTLDWAMFRTVGQNWCLVHYAQREGDREQTLDRFALLGHPNPAEAPAEVRGPESAEAARALGVSLCDKLAPKADVRLYARCPVQGRVEIAAAGETNLCADGNRGQRP